MAYKYKGKPFVSDDNLVGVVPGKTVRPEIDLIHQLINPNADQTTATGDNFGYSCAISEKYCVVSSTGEDGSSGRVYVFDVDTGDLIHDLENPNVSGTTAFDEFGESVAISGNIIVVGARLEDLNGNSSGSVYIFDAISGKLIYTLENPSVYSTEANDTFGSSVAISGNIVAVGAATEDAASGISQGAVYIYDLSSYTPTTETHAIVNPNSYAATGAADFFGTSIAVSGNILAVGADSEESISGDSGSGVVYVFNVYTGELLQTIQNPNDFNTPVNDFFGSSLAVDNNTLVVGAHDEDSSSGFAAGKVYVFNVSTGELLLTIDNPQSTATGTEEFGYSVSVSGNRIVVGAVLASEPPVGGTNDYGKVYIFDTETGNLLNEILSPSLTAQAYFGYSVAIKNNKFVVGATGYDTPYTGTGTAYIYNIEQEITSSQIEQVEFSNNTLSFNFFGDKYFNTCHNTCQALQYIKNPNAEPVGGSSYDRFGNQVAVDGPLTVVGAWTEDDAGGVNLESGKVYVFETDSGKLLHTIDNPNAFGSSSGDYFGSAVAISGNIVAVGAKYEDDSGVSSSGKVYVFDLSSSTPTTEIHTINNPNIFGSADSDYFFNVDLSGNILIVGADGEEDASGTNSGKVYVYDLSSATPTSPKYTIANPTPIGAGTGDQFGYDVAISGNKIIIGAPYEDDANSDSGKAYIYDAYSGELLHTLDNPNADGTSASDRFGLDVAISGIYCAVTARFETANAGATSESGVVYVYNVITGGLLYTITNPDFDNDGTTFEQFGASLAIWRNRLAVGCWQEDLSNVAGSEPATGIVYIFDLDSGDLINVLTDPNAYDTRDSDRFGFELAMNGNRLVASAYGEHDPDIGVGDFSGAVYTFSVNRESYLEAILNRQGMIR